MPLNAVLWFQIPLSLTHTHRDTRCDADEVEEARMHCALTGSLNAGFMPLPSLCIKGGASTSNFASDMVQSLVLVGEVRPLTPLQLE